MNNRTAILFVAIAAFLFYSFRKKKKGDIEVAPPMTFTSYIMSAGSVLYSNLSATSNTGQVFRGGEQVWLVKDYGNMKQVNYIRPDQKVLTGYVKTIDIRK